ncbi:hypothetical protein Cni_G08974 [Canna indica]|uniref:DUF642 domain-containing protein n=1 Tax=Canna indica TaxID=4628 RepID=A0AAQ3Q652_9LILI|nr:hypothetical protein Cni_G08974 [Canna indica]
MQVLGRSAILRWETSGGFMEYIQWDHKQGNMLLVVPEGSYADHLDNNASIKQKRRPDLRPWEERLNVSASPESDVLPMKTMYNGNGTPLGYFKEDPYIIPNTCGILIPPHIEDDHSPLSRGGAPRGKGVRHRFLESSNGC